MEDELTNLQRESAPVLVLRSDSLQHPIASPTGHGGSVTRRSELAAQLRPTIQSQHDTENQVCAGRQEQKPPVHLEPEELRTTLILSEYLGLSHAEIGSILNCSAKAIETRLCRAPKQLKSILARFLS
jgi:predicted DNA-binding protein (UPF0251 family)